VPPKKGDPCEPPDPASFQPLLDFVENEVFPMEVDHARTDFIRCALHSKMLKGLVVHLSEGAPTDASAHREFNMLKNLGLLQPGVNIIHGTALRPADFKIMSDSKVGLIWSPRSNDELYGGTTNISAAQQMGVQIALAPDWSPSGSAGMLQEIGYAGRQYKIAPDILISMATNIPASLVRMDDKIGNLRPGTYGDFVAVRSTKEPLQSIVRATPADIVLVVVGGKPLYGDEHLMRQLRTGDQLDELTVCGSRKAIFLGESAASGIHKTFDNIKEDLEAALKKVGSYVSPIECE
jgi:5-methylthioadenosine/S-adenosylhomocysteine deaminase